MENVPNPMQETGHSLLYVDVLFPKIKTFSILGNRIVEAKRERPESRSRRIRLIRPRSPAPAPALRSLHR